jgi:hypothetical protein
VVTAAGIADRIRRLEALTLALAREGQLLRAAEDPLLFAERRDYLMVIGSAAVALDEARVVLAQAGSGSTSTGRGEDEVDVLVEGRLQVIRQRVWMGVPAYNEYRIVDAVRVRPR